MMQFHWHQQESWYHNSYYWISMFIQWKSGFLYLSHIGPSFPSGTTQNNIESIFMWQLFKSWKKVRISLQKCGASFRLNITTFWNIKWQIQSSHVSRHFTLLGPFFWMHFNLSVSSLKKYCISYDISEDSSRNGTLW